MFDHVPPLHTKATPSSPPLFVFCNLWTAPYEPILLWKSNHWIFINFTFSVTFTFWSSNFISMLFLDFYVEVVQHFLFNVLWAHFDSWCHIRRHAHSSWQVFFLSAHLCNGHSLIEIRSVRLTWNIKKKKKKTFVQWNIGS